MSEENVKETVDASDNLIENQDLLEILGADSQSMSELEKAMSEEDNDAANRKMEELKEIATQLGSSTKGSNPGSGDLDTDLSNWFEGVDSLPSDKLNSYVGNSTIKMDYGLTKQTLTNFGMMGKLNKFLDASFETIFDESAVMGLTPDELLDRVKVAFTMYKELGALNQRTVMSMKDFRMKSGSESDEIDKISLLLSSIPSDKLKSLLTELSNK